MLVTRFLAGSWQYRRLFLRLPPDRPRSGRGCSTRWPACSSNCTATACSGATARWRTRCSPATGRLFAAHLVDAETSEIHPTLSDGQREHDLDIIVENVASPG